MFVHVERTPNPRTIKFLPGAEIASEPFQFYSRESAASDFQHPLLCDERIEGIFVGLDFLAVTLAAPHLWDESAEGLKAKIKDLIAGGALPEPSDRKARKSGLEDPVQTRIIEFLDTHVRPAVAQDGGDIRFASFDNGVLHLEMHGACSGCPSAAATLRQGIQTLLSHYVPEVREVRSASVDPAYVDVAR